MLKILIWGTGVCSKLVEKNGLNGKIVGYIETVKRRGEYNGLPVYGAEDIPDIYDLIIVANTYADEIYQICGKLGINLDKFIFLYPARRQPGITDNDFIKDVLQEKNYANYCNAYGLKKHSFFEEDKEKYRSLNRRESFAVNDDNLWPVIGDKYASAGSMNNYFWQDLWAAKLIRKSGVDRHFDIGSRIDGFIAHLLAMGIDVTLIDVREFPGEVEGLHTIVDDATALKQLEDDSIASMSALCSLEHFGLGRYGDPIDPEACFKCFEEIQKRMKIGGNLYISVPIGHERLEFNAHRVFYAGTIIECFSNMKLMEFSCVAENQIEYHADIHKYDDDMHNGEYRYGLFWFKKMKN